MLRHIQIDVERYVTDGDVTAGRQNHPLRNMFCLL